jgi:hypothetical protein
VVVVDDRVAPIPSPHGVPTIVAKSELIADGPASELPSRSKI